MDTNASLKGSQSQRLLDGTIEARIECAGAGAPFYRESFALEGIAVDVGGSWNHARRSKGCSQATYTRISHSNKEKVATMFQRDGFPSLDYLRQCPNTRPAFVCW